MIFVHRCPKCRGLNTERVGCLSPWETLWSLFVRRYTCLDCNWPFFDLALNLRRVRIRPARR